jgi:hypothetical protein
MNNIFPPSTQGSTVYVVIEITDPNLCFALGQKEYIKYDDRKQLAIIGTYEDRHMAEIECSKSYGRYVLTSEFHPSQLPFLKPPIFQNPVDPFILEETTKSFVFTGQEPGSGSGPDQDPFFKRTLN